MKISKFIQNATSNWSKGILDLRNNDTQGTLSYIKQHAEVVFLDLGNQENIERVITNILFIVVKIYHYNQIIK